jgi:hypothetical protein
MQGQLLIGGTKPEDSPTFRTLLAKVGSVGLHAVLCAPTRAKRCPFAQLGHRRGTSGQAAGTGTEAFPKKFFFLFGEHDAPTTAPHTAMFCLTKPPQPTKTPLNALNPMPPHPQEHRRIRGEYESRLRELEAERQMFEEDLAQVGGGWKGEGAAAAVCSGLLLLLEKGGAGRLAKLQ